MNKIYCLRPFLMGLIAFLLSGCIEMDYLVDIKSDMSTIVNITTRIQSEFARQTDQNSFNKICKDELTSSGKDRIQFNKTLSEGYYNCNLRIYINNILKPSSHASSLISEYGISIKSNGLMKYIVEINTSPYGYKGNEDTQIMSSGHYLTAEVRGSKIISSNSSVNKDNNISSLKIPMYNFITNEKDQYAFVVEVEGKPNWLPF